MEQCTLDVESDASDLPRSLQMERGSPSACIPKIFIYFNICACVCVCVCVSVSIPISGGADAMCNGGVFLPAFDNERVCE